MPERNLIETIEESQDALDDLVADTTFELMIFSQDLEARMFNRPRFLASLQKVATYSRRSKIQILVMDSGPAIRSGHRLIEISRRLTSYIEIRRVNREYADDTRTFMLCDQNNFYYRPVFSSYKAAVETDNPVGCKELRNFFVEVWESSAIDPEFRRLSL